MKVIKFYLIILVLSISFLQCSNSTEPVNQSNSTTDHTVSKNGVMHKSGLSSPTTNCVSCHGSDLRGGEAGVSCYSCHGKKW